MKCIQHEAGTCRRPPVNLRQVPAPICRIRSQRQLSRCSIISHDAIGTAATATGLNSSNEHITTSAISTSNNIVAMPALPTQRYFPTKQAVCVGIAADSGCGKTTFVRRVAAILSGFDNVCKKPKGNPQTNSLVGKLTTVLCLDDFHLLDRTGRKERGITALSPLAQDFNLMYQQVKSLKEGIPVMKPIYNHASGLLDPPEKINPTQFLMLEGLHPFYDERVRSLLDFMVYLNVSDDVKFVWKMLRDMKERGHTADAVRKSIEQRRPDFVNFVHPQIDHADIVIKVDLPFGVMTEREIEELCLTYSGGTGGAEVAAAPLPLRVTMEQRLDGKVMFPPVQFVSNSGDEYSAANPDSSIQVAQSLEGASDMVKFLGAAPTGNPAHDRHLFAVRSQPVSCDLPSLIHKAEPHSQFALSKYPGYRELCRPAVSVSFNGQLEDTAQIDELEGRLLDAGVKQKGELADIIVKTAYNLGLPGSKDATGLCQTITALKVREACEKAVAAQGDVLPAPKPINHVGHTGDFAGGKFPTWI